MDGQENPYAQIYSAKFHEVQKFLSITGHVYTPAYVTVGAQKWSKLSNEIRAILEKVARESQAYVYSAAEREEVELLDKIKAAGVKVNTADKDAFIRASKGIYDDFSKEVNGAKELIDKAQALGR